MLGRWVFRTGGIGFPVGVSPSPNVTTIQVRYRHKKWFGDEVQLFVNDYQHRSHADHVAMQIKKARYARKGKVAPNANDYDSEVDDISDILAESVPPLANPEKFKKSMKEKMEEAYKDYFRETVLAKDNPRSPYYFATEEEAKQAAHEHAAEAVLGHYEQQMDEKSYNQNPEFPTKYKLVSDVRPYDSLDHSPLKTTYLPEPDPTTVPHYDAYYPEFPLHPFDKEKERDESTPVVYPKRREPQLRPDGSAVARGTRKSAIAYVTIRRGTGNITVNRKPIIDYFKLIESRDIVVAPFLVTETMLDFDAIITVRGGGHTGNYFQIIYIYFFFNSSYKFLQVKLVLLVMLSLKLYKNLIQISVLF